jgi:hypothetical protein
MVRRDVLALRIKGALVTKKNTNRMIVDELCASDSMSDRQAVMVTQQCLGFVLYLECEFTCWGEDEDRDALQRLIEKTFDCGKEERYGLACPSFRLNQQIVARLG